MSAITVRLTVGAVCWLQPHKHGATYERLDGRRGLRVTASRECWETMYRLSRSLHTCVSWSGQVRSLYSAEQRITRALEEGE